MRTINDIAVRKIAEKYELDPARLSEYIRQGRGGNAFHLAVCIAQRFGLGPVWYEIRRIIHESEERTGVLP